VKLRGTIAAAAFQLDDPGDLGVLDGEGGALLVGVVAAPVLLAVAARLAEQVPDGDVAFGRVAGRREALAARPRDVETGEVGHLVGAERKAEGAHRGVDLRHRGAVLQHLVGGLAVGHEQAVGDEAVADLGPHRDLAEAAGEVQRGRHRVGGGPAPTTISRSRMTFAGEKKWRPITSPAREVPAARRSMSR
jgi:hypothetical protein